MWFSSLPFEEFLCAFDWRNALSWPLVCSGNWYLPGSIDPHKDSLDIPRLRLFGFGFCFFKTGSPYGALAILEVTMWMKLVLINLAHPALTLPPSPPPPSAEIKGLHHHTLCKTSLVSIVDLNGKLLPNNNQVFPLFLITDGVTGLKELAFLRDLAEQNSGKYGIQDRTALPVIKGSMMVLNQLSNLETTVGRFYTNLPNRMIDEAVFSLPFSDEMGDGKCHKNVLLWKEQAERCTPPAPTPQRRMPAT